MYEVLILLGHFQMHQIFRNDLLRLNWLEVLLERDQISTSLFGVFNLLEFH